MPDNKPMPPKDEESKKDTVRINLPPSITGKPPQKPGAATQPVSGSDVTQPLVPPGPPPARPAMPDVTQPITPPGTTQPLAAPGAPADLSEAKKETAVMGKPPATALPKADTSRVSVPSSTSPTAAPEAPRPTVKLRRETEAPAVVPTAEALAAKPAVPGTSVGPTTVVTSGVDTGLAVAAMVLSLAVVGYLAYLVFG